MKNIERYLKSKINFKIIRFFLENPSSIDTSRGIATWINEKVEKTEKALKELVKARIVVSQGNKATSAYSSTTDTHILSKLKTCLSRKRFQNNV